MEKENLRKYNAFRDICLKNAEDFLRTAESLVGKNVNHIAFHLAALAMEEVGRVSLAWFQIAGNEKDSEIEINLSADDHIKKLFWAIWGPSFGREKITKEQIEQRKNMATGIHNRRLFSLYTELTDTQPSRDKISKEELEQLIKFARAVLELAKAKGAADENLSANDLVEINWFLEANEDPEKRKLIFGAKSQEKLIELANVRDWIRWLKEIFDNTEKEAREAVQKELQRQEPMGAEKEVPKWRMKFRITSPSHTVKEKNLNKFNTGSHWIKVHKGFDNHTLIVELVFTKNTPAQLLWDRGWMVSRMFVASLNVGTGGVFWWNVPVDISRYYDEIWDLENKINFFAEVNPKLQINWRELKWKLDQTGLNNASIVFSYLVRIMDSSEFEPIKSYLDGLAMLAKNDVHLRLELNSFDQFFTALRQEFLLTKDWDPEKESLKDVAFSKIGEALPHRDELDKLIDLGIELQQKREKFSKPITLTEVIGMKHYCDLYFLKLAARKFYEAEDVRLVAEKNDTPTTGSSG